MPQWKKKVWLWIVGSLGVSGILFILLFALLGLSLIGMMLAASDSTYEGQPMRSAETLDFPLPLLSVYLKAQNSAADWSQLAAVCKVTADFGKHPADSGGIGFAGFPVALWQQVGMDGDADGIIDPDDPKDAIDSLAAYFMHASVPFDQALTTFGLTDAQSAEVEKIAAAYQASVWMPYGWLWPLIGYRSVSSPYGMRSDPFTGEDVFHDGIDLPAPEGTPVLAIRDGTVLDTLEDPGGYGKRIDLIHPDGTESFYGHLSVVGVEPGQSVHQGEVIGAVGSTGRATGPHLHLGMRLDGHSVDPMKKWLLSNGP